MIFFLLIVELVIFFNFIFLIIGLMGVVLVKGLKLKWRLLEYLINFDGYLIC